MVERTYGTAMELVQAIAQGSVRNPQWTCERWLAQGFARHIVDERHRAAFVAATSYDHDTQSGCHCSTCEILRGEHDEILHLWQGES